MYKQTKKSGGGEFLKVLGITLAVIIISEFMGGLLNLFFENAPFIPLIKSIFLVAACVVIIYFTYNHYASSFLYKISKTHIVIEKKTGRRVTEYDIPLDKIKKMIIKKEYPDLKEYKKKKGKKLRLCPTVFGYKKNTVIVCGEENSIVIFEPDDNFINKMKEYMND